MNIIFIISIILLIMFFMNKNKSINIQIKKSNLSNSGNGVFAGKDFKINEYIEIFPDNIKVSIRLTMDYKISLVVFKFLFYHIG